MRISLSSVKLAQIYNDLISKYAPSEAIVVTSDDYFANYAIEKILVDDIKKIATACETYGYTTADWMETAFPANLSWSPGLLFSINPKAETHRNTTYPVVSEGFAETVVAAWSNCYYLSHARHDPIITKITDAPIEHVEEQITYRLLTSAEAVSTYNVIKPKLESSTVSHNHGVMAVPHTSPLYNYLDKGNYLLFYRLGGKLIPIAVNEMSYDIYKLLLLISLLGSRPGANPLENTPYINVGLKREFIRTSLLRLEAQLAKLKDAESDWQTRSRYEDYFSFSKGISARLMLNAKNSLYAQLLTGEIASFKLDDMLIEPNKISYENVSVEYPALAKAMQPYFANHNPSNSPNILPINIYNVVEEVISWMSKDLEKNARPKYDDKQNVVGFTEAYSHKVTINGMPIELGVTTQDTRRRINGFRINMAEVSDVLKQAACYQSSEQYHMFLADVQNMSLQTRKALTSGVPMKFELMDSNNYYELRRPATLQHPKLKFTLRDGQAYLVCEGSDIETQYFKVQRFTSCVQWLQTIDRKTRIRSGSYRGYPDGPIGRLKDEFKVGIIKFCPQLAGQEKIKDAIIASTCVERKLAQQRSEKLLEEIVGQIGCTEGTYNGEAGYIVKGKLRNYFVSKVPPYKVWNHDSGKYICIVNGDHYTGVGYDALVTRLLALANDSYSAGFISTLKAAA